MNCKNCGALLEEDSMFCINCGAKVEAEPEQPAPVSEPIPAAPYIPAPVAEKPKAKVSAAKVIGLIVGTLLIIIGLTRILDAGSSISSASFGGDFYTYTYRGIVAISNQLASIQASLGWVVVAIGAAIDVHALRS